MYGIKKLGFVIMVNGEMPYYIGIRGARMSHKTQDERLLFHSEESAKCYIRRSIHENLDMTIMPVYKEQVPFILYKEKKEVASKEKETLMLTSRKRPRRVRKDPFKRYDKIPKLK